jgi:hypothetical protein
VGQEPLVQSHLPFVLFHLATVWTVWYCLLCVSLASALGPRTYPLALEPLPSVFLLLLCTVITGELEFPRLDTRPAGSVTEW